MRSHARTLTARRETSQPAALTEGHRRYELSSVVDRLQRRSRRATMRSCLRDWTAPRTASGRTFQPSLRLGYPKTELGEIREGAIAIVGGDVEPVEAIRGRAGYGVGLQLARDSTLPTAEVGLAVKLGARPDLTEW
jgi:hypothetical protein